MYLLFNDLSLHGQFHDVESFRFAVGNLIRIREIGRQYGRQLYIGRDINVRAVFSDRNFHAAVGGLSKDQIRAVANWISTQGPFWEDDRFHSSDSWLECLDKIVTDNAAGEAGWCVLRKLVDKRLISVTPSDWCISPLSVSLKDQVSSETCEVVNYWEPDVVKSALVAAPRVLSTWTEVATVARARFTRIIFSDDAFEPLDGLPFSMSAANRLIVIFSILDRLKHCFDANGHRTAEGHDIYSQYFTGKKGDGGRGALFSDSSATEKNDFAAEMNFNHPKIKGEKISCTWHGKVQTPQLRVHFSYPITHQDPLFVVYAGMKITKR